LHSSFEDPAQMNQQTSAITYDSPPLVEVAMSVQFEPPKGLTSAHLGAFWSSQQVAYPSVRSLRPIAATNETFGEANTWLPPALLFAVTDEPDVRVQMTSTDDQWMCQIQRDRLVVNWRKRDAGYPRFDATWTRFQKIWADWLLFLAEGKFLLTGPRLWELTYVNRIKKAGLWKTPADWPSVFPGLWGGAFAAAEGATLSGFQGQWVWETASPAARLFVEPRPGRTAGSSPEDVLLLSLTARGPLETTKRDLGNDSGSVEAIESGMNCGHNFIVTTFDRIASLDAKKTWGRHGNTH
jgi:uncharacterized protein (TIGR04255 family)